MHKVRQKSQFKLQMKRISVSIPVRILKIAKCHCSFYNNLKPSDNYKNVICIKVIEKNVEHRTVALLFLELITYSGY